MFEYGFQKCGGCISAILFGGWRNDPSVKTYRPGSSSNFNGYLDIDADDPFASDDELVFSKDVTQSDSLLRQQRNGGSGRKTNYYRGNVPAYHKPTPPSNSGDKKTEGDKLKRTQRSSTAHQKPTTAIEKVKKKEGNAEPDEFEQFLQNANKKSDEMRHDVEAYLKTTDNIEKNIYLNDVVTTQPNKISSHENALLQDLHNQPSTDSLLD